jgi:hypothetical protein
VKQVKPLYMGLDDSIASKQSDLSYLRNENYGNPTTDEEDQPGAALKVVKQKWTELGPLRLEDIMANSGEPIDQGL